MNKEVADALAQAELARVLGASSPSEMTRYLDEQDTYSVVGADGVEYQVEVSALWDDRRKGRLRVLVGIDAGGLRQRGDSAIVDVDTGDPTGR